MRRRDDSMKCDGSYVGRPGEGVSAAFRKSADNRPFHGMGAAAETQETDSRIVARGDR